MSTVMQLLGQVEEQGWSRVGVRSFESSSQSAAGLPLVITATCACSILLHNGYSHVMSAIWSCLCDEGCCTHTQVRTAWKVWRTWSNGGGETGLRFDDSNVQKKLAIGLVDSEKVSPVIPLTPLAPLLRPSLRSLLLLFFFFFFLDVAFWL